MSNYPVFVSITSLPSRIESIRPCLESLLSGSIVPNKIVIALPRFSERERLPYALPDFLKSTDFGGSIVEVISVDRDQGPGTKLLGALSVIPPSCYLILADDDVRYKKSFLEGLLKAQRADHSRSFSYYTYRIGGLTVGQGCDGFSFWLPNLSGISSFAEKYVFGTDLSYHDDLWISFYLASKGIPIKSLEYLLGGRTIYEADAVHGNSLRFLTGPLDRDVLNREGLKRLLDEVEMPSSRRLKMKMISQLDQYVFRPSKQILRKSAKLISTISIGGW